MSTECDLEKLMKQVALEDEQPQKSAQQEVPCSSKSLDSKKEAV